MFHWKNKAKSCLIYYHNIFTFFVLPISINFTFLFQYDWSYNIGEQALDIAVVSNQQNTPVSLLILGNHFLSLFH